ncbi:MAG: aminodeoxychorismate/anthranilate synthase component II [Flavobacterium sp.]|nr:aminodeoxychorismate/anthranilate synthase component II [Flavobacterium sp.]
MIKIAVIDNYDSFTFNLVHYLEALDCSVIVFRNDEFELDELESFDKILLSPGPGLPDQAGLLKDVIRKFASSKSILGICLGQQAIAEVFGGSLINLEKVYHGVSGELTITASNESLFDQMESPVTVGRYHSWSVNRHNFPDVLEITSTDTNGEIMSLRHKIYDIRGVQFHPESVLTPGGKQLLSNWLRK